MAPRSTLARWAASAAAVATTMSFVALGAAPAQADTVPPNPADPLTVSSDALPTVQIDGVVWDQEVVGNTVYVAGEFTKARPAGAAPGTNEVTRTHLLAYNLTTGVLISSFAPNVNAQVRDLAASPDGTRLYAAGNFTSIDGQARYRVASFSTSSGALISSFRPTVNGVVTAIDASASTLFIGGNFSSVNSQPRTRFAALNAGTGSTLPPAPVIDGGAVQAIVAAPDGGSVVIGGAFTSVDGSSNPGYGLARLSASDGALMPLPVNTQIRNGGLEAAILSLETDGDTFYGSGYHYGDGGNVEGSFSADWATGSLRWVEDCHGDTYSVYPMGDVVYSASHKHYCGNSGGFPQTNPWTYYRATANTKAATGVNTADIYGYEDHPGEPSPTILNWYPSINTGTYTGKSQGPWSVTAANGYVLYGGEFTQVNGTPQQGLVRFTTVDRAPNLDGPRLTGTNYPLTLASYSAGEVRLSWKTNWDRDNETLTYKVYRGTETSAPIHTETVSTTFWRVKTMRLKDAGLVPGSSQRYRVVVSDPFGNTAKSPWTTVTVSETSVSPYATTVLDDAPVNYWRLGEPSGTAVADWAGGDDAVAQAGVTRGITGAVPGDTDLASSFNGMTTGSVSSQTAVPASNSLSIEAWFRTTSRTGGKIVGFGNRTTGNSTNYDRHVYMDTAGRVLFGAYPGERRVLTSTRAYNDGGWHHVVGTLGADGMRLYVDGVRVAQRADTKSGQNYSGYWRIGGDTAWSGAAYFNGAIDEVAIYDTPLTPAQIDAHWTAAGGTTNIPPRPADEYGQAVYDLQPDLFWRLDETTGTTAVDAGPIRNDGTYSGTVTKGRPGVLPTGTAVEFSGVTGLVASTTAWDDPVEFSQELWFSTTSTLGGKLIGFGDKATGTSTDRDRHVVMETDGRLSFGVWTGVANTITTDEAYNDGEWHHLVASQSAAGMRLYVDGVLVGQHPQTNGQAYIGYWRIGGDTTWGPQPWFTGLIDEVAVYSQALDAVTVGRHYALGAGVPAPNLAPVAAFTPTTDLLTLSVDASASSDEDGSVATYTWDWADGSAPETTTTPTATHTYAAAGTYDVTLTVTDDGGATAQAVQPVTVVAPPPNVAPTAALTTQVTQLSVVADGSGSTDTDGSVVSYAWQWGDGSEVEVTTTPTASHTYAASGTYTVELTVTDDEGATASAQAEAVAVEPLETDPFAVDDFTRTVTGGWGAAPIGGEWTATGLASRLSVDGAGRLTVPRSGTAGATLAGIAQGDTTARATFGVQQLPTATSFATLLARTVDTNGYGARLRLAPDGSVQLHAVRVTGTTTTALAGGAVAGLTVTPGVPVLVRVDAEGTAPTAVRVKAWAAGTPEPEEWRAAVTDATEALQVPGGVGVSVYHGGVTGATPLVFTVDDFTAGPIGVAPVIGPVDPGDPGDPGEPVDPPVDPPANVAPTAAFTLAASGLGVQVDAAASTDTDGTVASYRWTWGDGTPEETTASATATHQYAAAGSYPVSLTVVDDDGATATATGTAVVTAPEAGAPLVADDFARVVVDGWGAALTGGDWTAIGAANRLAADGATGRLTLPAGATGGASHGAVTPTDVDVQATIGLDRLSTGNSFVTLQGRRVGADSYGARVRIAPDGAVQLHVTREVGGVVTPLSGGVVDGLALAPGELLRVRLEVSGAGTTTVRAKVWKVGQDEPADWRATRTDTTAALQVPGTVGAVVYHGGATGSAPVTFTFDDLQVLPLG